MPFPPHPPQPDDLGSFFRENKSLLKEYLETRLEILRLQALRIISQAAGNLAWIIVSLFLVFLFILFAGLAFGYWLSNLLHSYARGFGLTALLLLLMLGLLAAFGKSWFVTPVVRKIIDQAAEITDEEEDA
jgi:hypothetical protein